MDGVGGNLEVTNLRLDLRRCLAWQTCRDGGGLHLDTGAVCTELYSSWGIVLHGPERRRGQGPAVSGSE